MPSILFVCTGNQIRSPLAAAVFKEAINNTQENIEQWQVDSAGTWAKADYPPNAVLSQWALSQGIDLRAHKTKRVSEELLSGADLILVMEAGHKEALRYEFPSVAERVFLLLEIEGPGYGIPDPQGKEPAVLLQVSKEIVEIITKQADQICEKAEALSRHSTEG